MKKITGLGLIVLLVALPMAAQADGFAVGARTSLYTISPGYGLELTYPVNPKLNLRLAHDTGSFSAPITLSGGTVSAALNTSATSAFVDWQVFSGNFRVTGGYVANGNNATFSGTGTFGQPIPPTTTVAGNISFPGSSPYVGIGFGNAVKSGRGLGFSTDVGVLLQGTPTVNITSASGLTPSEIATLENDMQNTLNQVSILPVFSMVLSYQF